ncbi:MAG: TatD family hydrolase [Paracoccaceae bacterium]
MPPLLVDSHCHLDLADFVEELPQVIARANNAGVTRMVSICTRLRLELQVRTIAETYEGVFYAAGVHPMSVASEPMVLLQELLDLSYHPKFVGIGETGLDYHYSSESKIAQIDSLLVHIEAAHLTGLPLIIHARDADEDMAKILTSEFKKRSYTCVMHCFSSSNNLGKAALDLGFYLSMSGITTFPKSGDLRHFFSSAPLSQILLETDSPYLAPPPHRGRRNEPAFTEHTAKVGAEVFGLSLADFALATSANFDRLFWKAAAFKDEKLQVGPS